jgi:pyruvate/2-oxoglutarate dehydrogenase complex dihydrolipoamide acyltransferase (E2) component
MMSYYFVRIPKLPRDISHQSGAVTLIEYAAREGQMIQPGEVIAVVENWWARMQLKAIGPGLLSKTFFASGTAINEGDPLAILICDPEDGPKNDATCELTVVKAVRPKPSIRT